MDKTKAAEIASILILNNFDFTFQKTGIEPDINYTFIVVSTEGVSANALKNFQDNNNITIKARVSLLT